MPDWLAELLQHTFNGLVASGVYALLAVSITIVFGLTGTVNFALGHLMLLGAYIVYSLAPHIPYGFALVVCMIAIGCLSLMLERTVFGVVPGVTCLLASLGIILILQSITVELWGSYPRAVSPPLQQVLGIGGLTMPLQRWLILWVTGFLVVSFSIFLYRHKWGRAVRACAKDRYTASLMGIPVPTIIGTVFAVGGSIAALTGGLVVSTSAVIPYTGIDYLFKALTVAVLGGLGSIEGALMAAFLVGITESFFGAYVSSSWRDAYSFALLIILLTLFPTGLRGSGSQFDIWQQGADEPSCSR
jgi:branched-chain amino acid transport system permease protein